MNGKRLREKKEPKWYTVMIVTAIVGGIITTIVNHIDAIAATFWSIIIHINWLNIPLAAKEVFLDPIVKLSSVVLEEFRSITVAATVVALRIPFFTTILTITVSVVLLGYLPTLIRSFKLLLKSLDKKYRGQQVHQLSLWNDDIADKQNRIRKIVAQRVMKLEEKIRHK